MKHKFLVGIVLGLMLMFVIGIIPVSAESNTDAVAEVQGFIDGIVAYQLKKSDCESIQNWIDGELTKNAGYRSEWYILALSQSGEYDFTAYEMALLRYLEENNVSSASSRQKYALILSAVGSTDSYISSVLNDSVGKQGVMSLVYGLHLLNNGYRCEEYTAEAVAQKLLLLQHEDGGWSFMGQYGDVDVTAMALQSLAPYYDAEISVKEAVDAALSFLSLKQLENGDYTSYGVANSESASQVIVALSALGIDCETDERFIKNGITLIDVLAKYRLSDGSFSHEEGGASNDTATMQVFYAMVSYLRMSQGRAPLYILDYCNPDEAEPYMADAEPSDDEISSETQYKPLACLVIGLLGGAVCIVLFLLKKRNYKNYAAVLAVAAVMIVFVCVTDFQSADDYYNGEDIVKENVIGTVTLSIRCDAIAEMIDSEYISDDGMILGASAFDIEEGDTVYDILTEAARKYHIQLENNGTSEMAYISGIQYLYEFDYGDLSGWIYRVNGRQPSVSCGEYALSDGDVIEFLYTLELGKDMQ